MFDTQALHNIKRGNKIIFLNGTHGWWTKCISGERLNKKYTFARFEPTNVEYWSSISRNEYGEDQGTRQNRFWQVKKKPDWPDDY